MVIILPLLIIGCFQYFMDTNQDIQQEHHTNNLFKDMKLDM
jgi:hypothetical protein